MTNLIYVTGANGFIGQNLVTYLAQQGYIVYALLRPGSIPSFSLHQNIHIVYGDLTDQKSLYQTIPKHSIVVNLAANPYHKTLSYTVNVLGTTNLVSACEENKVKKFIQVSSQATKIKIQGVYAKTKNASDHIVRESELNYVILKPSLVYGGGEKGLFNRIKSLARVLPFVPVFGDGTTRLYPIEVGDFARIVHKIIDDQSTDKNEFDVGSSKYVTYNDLYSAILGGSKESKLLHIPSWIGLLLAKALSVLPNPPIYEDNVLGSTQDTACNPTPILKRYNFKPVLFKEGVKQVMSPYRVKIAVVGLGKMGTLHMSILHTFNEVEIVALVDTNITLYNTVKSMGISGNFYTSLEEACKNEKIDAVYIITPTFTHLDLIKIAIKNKLHIFIEKPVTLSVAELKVLMKIKYDKVIHTGYTLLNNPIYKEVEKIIKEKRFGQVVDYTGKFEHGEVFGAKKGWMFNKKLSGGGVLMNPGPHFFSLLNMFFGKPNKIEGKIRNIYLDDLDDEVDATLIHNKFKGKIFLSWSVKGLDVAKSSFVIKFENATLSTDGANIIVVSGKKKVRIVPPDDQSYKEIFNINPKANGEAYYIENRAFIDAILGSKIKVPNKLESAIETEQTIFNIYEKCLTIKDNNVN